MQICKCIKIFTSIFSNFNIKQVHMYQKTRSLNSLSKIILQEEEEEAISISSQKYLCWLHIHS